MSIDAFNAAAYFVDRHIAEGRVEAAVQRIDDLWGRGPGVLTALTMADDLMKMVRASDW